MTRTNTKNIRKFVSSNSVILLALLLTTVAALPRLYNLGDLGFYMDEETTAFASRSMTETGTPKMPSGMPYYRSLPHTWLNSISVKIFGADEEFSYRLPAAIFGILTIPLVFLLALPYTGVTVAFVAALLLAVSEWHVITSRQARMYAPFLFFYVSCTFSILSWARNGSMYFLIFSAILFVIATGMHNLGVFLAFIPLITLYIRDNASISQYKLILFSIIAGITSYLYGEIFVARPYAQWMDTYGISGPNSTSVDSLLNIINLTPTTLLLVVVGSALGIWLASLSRVEDNTNGKEFRILSRYALAIFTSLFAATGHLHGAILSFLLLLYTSPYSFTAYIRATWRPLLGISLIAASITFLAITEHGLIPGLKSLLSFPYPNWTTLFLLSPGLTIIFIFMLLYYAAKNNNSSDNSVILFLVICLLPVILVGIFKKWAAARYLIMAYPFMLIVCAYALSTLTQKLLNKLHLKASLLPLVIVFIALSGIISGHGIVAAYRTGTMNYGDEFNEKALIFPFYPDHKSPGLFVAKHRRDSDIVIAEDVLTQRWYAGEMDYWLRKYSETGGVFLYKGQDGLLRDIYVNSISATHEILENINSEKDRRIWIISSGETYTHRGWYLTKEQQNWMDRITSENHPIFTGADGITKVYCLNCGSTN